MIDNNTGNNIAFDAIKIGMASRSRSASGPTARSKKPETINYRTLKPERDGLFCERIFGPPRTGSATAASTRRSATRARSATAAAWRSPGPRSAGSAWATSSWPPRLPHLVFQGHPSRMGLLLDISPRILEKVLYFANYIVTDPGGFPLTKNQILSEKEYRDMREKYEDDFQAGMGAEAVKKLLQDVDLEAALRPAPRGAEGRLRPEEGPDRQAPGGGGRLPPLRQQARVDDHRRAARHPAGAAPHGASWTAAGSPPPT